MSRMGCLPARPKAARAASVSPAPSRPAPSSPLGGQPICGNRGRHPGGSRNQGNGQTGFHVCLLLAGMTHERCPAAFIPGLESRPTENPCKAVLRRSPRSLVLVRHATATGECPARPGPGRGRGTWGLGNKGGGLCDPFPAVDRLDPVLHHARSWPHGTVSLPASLASWPRTAWTGRGQHPSRS